MKKAIEFNIKDEELKKYLEDCLKENKIEYEIKIEDRWIQKFKQASKYYQVYCIYVNSSDLNKAKDFVTDFEKGRIVADNIEELKNAKEDEVDNRFKKFTIKNFLKYYWIALLVIGIIMIIAMKYTM